MKMKGKYLPVALVIAGIIVGYIGYTLYAPSETAPTPTPTPTPTPVQMISFEEAVEYALKGGEPKWKFSEHRWLGEFKGEPFVTPDGLVEGHLEWRASNGTLYEAEYSSGEIYGVIEHFTGDEDTEEYYVWKITLMDGKVCHIDARNGELLSISPSRVPGVLTFETGVRIIYAPQKRVEEWRVQEYKRIGDFESEPYETPDGLVKGHLLWRASNGTLYEVWLPHTRYTIGKVLYIEAPDDREEYNVWEITTENNVYYIDARNGIIRLILESPTPTPPVWHLMLRSVFLWENGKEQFVAGPDSDLCNYLLQTLPKINLQVNCSLSEEKVQEIQENDKIIVLRFRFTEDVTISQWIEPQDRDHIKTDEEGYRILEKFHKALFILEDNLDEGLQGHILVYSQTEGWSCWAIQPESGELDKTWIDEINGLLREALI